MSLFGQEKPAPATHSAEGALIKDGTDASFMADVVEPSKTTPVIVDFWAPWCGPCRQLGPAIERIVNAAKGAVRLVKINIDESPAVAQQLQVKSIPAVYAFKDGQPVDGFMGAQPESQLQAFVDRLTGETDINAEADALVERAKQSFELGDAGGAAQDFAGALQIDPQNAGARAGMARCYLHGGDVDGAKGLLADLGDEAKTHADIISVLAAIELTQNAVAGDQDSAALKAKVDANPDDQDTRYALAEALSAQGDMDGAAEHLLYAIARDREWNEQAARKLLLKLFDAAGSTAKLTVNGRKRLSTILFS